MKVLKVIHGYPPRFYAGSEIYSQTLCQALAQRHAVEVFTRAENPFMMDYETWTEQDPTDHRIKLNLINLPLEKHRYRYSNAEVDFAFKKVVDHFNPDIVHIGHLNHLSLTLVNQLPPNLPVVYTLHYYWLLCPRGQFIRRHSDQSSKELWPLCKKQIDKDCAIYCYQGYFSGLTSSFEDDAAYWSKWVKQRKECIKQVISRTTCFLCPSMYLLNKFKNEGIPAEKLQYLDYGFDLTTLRCKAKTSDAIITFGYIGTHIPAKGIDLLIKAFAKVKAYCKLKIWGNPRAQNTSGLKELVKLMPPSIQHRIEWLSEYDNRQITSVFESIDAIVVPSIWEENSPLVIHEALQARIPIITADVGGMSEYVQHEINGLLFKHRDMDDLASKMEFLIMNPKFANCIAKRGYIASKTGDIPSIDDHVQEIEKIYNQALEQIKENYEKQTRILENNL